MMSLRCGSVVEGGRAALTVSLLFLIVLAAAPSGAAPPAFVALLDRPTATIRPPSGAQPDPRRRPVVRQRSATARVGVLTHPDGSPAVGVGQRIELHLFDDAKFAVRISDVTRHSGRGPTWSGAVEGIADGYAVLAVHDGALVGQVMTPRGVYRIGYAPDGTQVVEQIDQAALPREAHEVVPKLAAAADSSEPKPVAPDLAADGTVQIDVMVLYTPAARAKAGGPAAMQAEVDLAVGSANQAYANNNLTYRLRLVFAGEIAITERTGADAFDDDLEHLRVNPTVAWLRDTTRADLVSLITEHGADSPFCGIGYVMTTNSTNFARFGFSVVERVCATAALTFAHEVGHNMGAHHDPYVTGGDTGLFAYSHGYVDTVGKFRTIMAYSDRCFDVGISCPRIPFFSNPGQTFDGRPIGTASTSDNARTFRQSATTVSNLRQALVGPPTLSTGVNQTSFAVGDTLVASVTLDNPERSGTADIYFGLLAPDNTAVFFTDTSGGAFVSGQLLDFASYRPVATGVSLATPFSADFPSFASYQWTGDEPRGGFALFLLVVTSGALADGVLATHELLGASLTPFSFPP
jgi:hypothetical protein